MTNCPNCSAFLDFDTSFCDQCGADIAPSNGIHTIGEATLGASSSCDFVLAQSTISSQHARVAIMSNGDYRITDLNSTNGTFVNGSRVQSTTIGRTDFVTLGSLPIDLPSVLAYLDGVSREARERRPAARAVAPPTPQALQPPPVAVVPRESPQAPEVAQEKVAVVRHAPQRSAFACPSCGSENAQRLSLFSQTTTQSGGGCGCSSCLLVLIIFILAPALVLIFGLAVGAVVAKFWPFIAGFFGMGLLINIITAIVNRHVFVCLRCGARFRPR